MKKYNMLSALLVASAVATGTPVLAGETHKEITGPFATPMDVTKKCLECHENAAMEVMKTTHWTWASEQEIAGKKGKVTLGKKNAINNFCISLDSNWPRCTSCHISYGWKDAKFDFNDKTRVDCLVCHDNTGTYKKAPPGAGMPFGFTGNPELDAKPVDLVAAAQSAGKPTRQNCVACHGFGGGGNNVKHGDIDSSMGKPTKAIDFHMGSDSLNFQCTECHATKEHQIAGNAMVVTPGGKNHTDCNACHDAKPHKSDRLNKHTATVACQTCHIPTFAKKMPTKMEWDWSTAGQDLKVEEQVFGEEKREGYDKKKGHFKWAQNVQPVYKWYNGSASVYLRGDKIDPAKVTELNAPAGSIKDMNAKIYPFKMHSGKQAYDKENKYFLTPKVWPSNKEDKDAYWKNFDWDKALRAGSEASGLPYSGSYAFAPTVMYWRINHMVAPASDALKCNACHNTNGGRLDWKALGYKGDPMKLKGAARTK
ncbi:MAG: tetrathionate reductase family octaheme c-type cytochrome [Thermodesulfobacteriota bacterium]